MLRATLKHLASGDGARPTPTTAPTPPTTLSPAQKSELYHQGVVVLRNAVAPHLVAAARERVAAAVAEDSNMHTNGLGQSPEITALRTESTLNPILEDLIDGSTGVWWCQPAIIPAPEEPAPELTPVSRISRDLHLDGCNAAQLPDGSTVDFVDLEKTLTIKPHGAGFLFVALSDQTELGCAQTHMLRRGHIAMEEFFNWQLEQFGAGMSEEREE